MTAKQPGADHQEAVDRRDRLSYRAFVTDYRHPNRPVVVTDAIDHWPALERWHPDFFADRYGDRDLGLDGCSVGELIGRIRQAEHGPVDDLPYLRNVSIDRHFPELRADISPMPVYVRPNWFENPLVPRRVARNRTDLFIGGRDGRFPYLHHDIYHGFAFIFQLFGEKEFFLIPPEQTPLVYPRETDNGMTNVSAITDIEHPDLDRFPLFARATPIRCTIRPGDMLFLPAGWWHTATMPTASISVSTNIANGDNWGALMADHWGLVSRRPVRAVAGMPYLGAIWAWETLRDALGRDRALRAHTPDP
ncbi:MAG: cupin-like domain-containing protein [Actinomycetota bacterium]